MSKSQDDVSSSGEREICTIRLDFCLNEVQVTVVADFCPKAMYRLPASWDTPLDHLQSTSQSQGDCGFIFLLRDDVSTSGELPRGKHHVRICMHDDLMVLITRSKFLVAEPSG